MTNIFSVSSKRIIPYEKNLFDKSLPSFNHLFIGQSEYKNKLIYGLIKSTQEYSSKRFNMLMLTPCFNIEMDKICKLSGGVHLKIERPKYGISLFKYPLEKSVFREDYLIEILKEVTALYPTYSLAYLKENYVNTNNFWGAPTVKRQIESEHPLVKIEVNYDNTIAHSDFRFIVVKCLYHMVKDNLDILVEEFYLNSKILTISAFRDFVEKINPALFIALSDYTREGKFPFMDRIDHDSEIVDAMKNGVIYISETLNCQNARYGFYSDFIIDLCTMNQNLSTEAKIFWWEPRSIFDRELQFIADATRKARKLSKAMVIVPHYRLDDFSGSAAKCIYSNASQTYLFKFSSIGSDIQPLIQGIPNGVQALTETLGDKFVKNVSKEVYPIDLKFMII